jgi:glycosyltransferase involved in cell wall biosynthesis
LFPRILINCSNLFNGGAVAVATSVIDCLTRMDHDGLSISVLMSSPVERNLKELGSNLEVFHSYETIDFNGLDGLWRGLDQHFAGYDLVFTVFGPAYFFGRNTKHVFGFAQPNIVYPKNLLTASMSPINRWFFRVKFEVQAWFFLRADELVVELEHVKIGLTKRHLFKRKLIHVVHSSVHSIFNNPQYWAPLNLASNKSRLRLGVISRNYPHKNLDILPKVKWQLTEVHRRNVDIFVTFTPQEWAACSTNFRDNIINVGGLSLSQCPTFYEAMDGVIFPSFLECFSAVPIEAMIMGRPLFASNLSFIRDVCGDNSQYFDPTDPVDIAQVINTYFALPKTEQSAFVAKATAYSQRYFDPEERVNGYLRIIRNALGTNVNK